MRSMNPNNTARALGWFSIGLGIAELFGARRLGRFLGAERSAGWIRAFGVREIAAGLGILSQARPRAGWLWARVAGDALDLAALGKAAAGYNPQRGAVWFSLANVAAVTALDVATARALPA
ncbi:MAG TPA: hypothetical protein VM691_05340 [Myxococcales bacterium]|nr:hypothetical protein [Myxococcales bacterium]